MFGIEDNNKNIKYDDIDIFDNWGIGYIANDKRFKVLFYDKYREEVMPTNYEVDAYKIWDEDVSIDGYTYYDTSGYKGEWEMILLKRYQGAV